MRKLDTEI